MDNVITKENFYENYASINFKLIAIEKDQMLYYNKNLQCYFIREIFFPNNELIYWSNLKKENICGKVNSKLLTLVRLF